MSLNQGRCVAISDIAVDCGGAAPRCSIQLQIGLSKAGGKHPGDVDQQKDETLAILTSEGGEIFNAQLEQIATGTGARSRRSAFLVDLSHLAKEGRRSEDGDRLLPAAAPLLENLDFPLGDHENAVAHRAFFENHFSALELARPREIRDVLQLDRGKHLEERR